MNNLIKRINDYIDKNELNLDRIIDDFTPYVRKIIDNMAKETLTYEDKDEVLADTFFILWKNQSKDIISLDAYIAGITRNLIREKLKKRKITYNIDECENITDYNVIDSFLEERLEIENCLKVLNKVDLKIFNMYYYYSKSSKEIANELKISEGNVYVRLNRIRKKLKKELNKGGYCER